MTICWCRSCGTMACRAEGLLRGRRLPLQSFQGRSNHRITMQASGVLTSANLAKERRLAVVPQFRALRVWQDSICPAGSRASVYINIA